MKALLNKLNKIIINVYSGQNNEDTENQLEELKILMKKNETRGGTRQGSGAKPKYNEQTKTVAFRCPLSKVDELKLIVKSKLSEWSVK
jgi:hypothetical protein